MYYTVNVLFFLLLQCFFYNQIFFLSNLLTIIIDIITIKTNYIIVLSLLSYFVNISLICGLILL